MIGEEHFGTSSHFEGKPKYLFRYCSVDRALQILGENRLFLCPPQDFNDLFEGTIARYSQFSEDHARKLLEKQVLGAGVEPAMAAEIAGDATVDQLKELFTQLASSFADLAASARTHSGVVCFSSMFANDTMWAHYAGNSSGVCIQFWHNEGNSPIHRHAQRVYYNDEDLTELLVDAIDGKRLGLDPEVFMRMLFLVKTRNWAYEEEWRIIMAALEPQPRDSRFLSFPPSAVRRVYAGPRVSDAQLEELRKLAREPDCPWSLVTTTVDVASGRKMFHGAEVMQHIDDFEWHNLLALPDR